MEDLSIKVTSVTKEYNLYRKPVHRLWESLIPFSKKSFHKTFKALDDVSFDVKKGECFGIIGKNGAGKSTILKIITGVLRQTHGDVQIDGNISALLELGAGFNMEYTGMQNIYMHGMVMGLSKEEMNKKVPSILEFADIGDFIYQPVKSYSSGMFARLAFALQINVDPDILIVDEALSVGDIFFQAKCYKKFEEFKNNGKTVLFVTHDMSSILQYCDRVLVLDGGQVKFLGDPREAVNIYKKILANTMVEQQKEEVSASDKQIDKDISESANWMNKLPLNPKPVIYGNGRGDILDFGIFNEKGELTNSLDQFSHPVIKVKVRTNETITNPIVAFKLKNMKNEEILGTNTMYENCDIKEMAAGKTYLVSFKFDLPLSAGEYLLDIGFTSYASDQLEVINRYHEITTVDVLSKRHNVGCVNPNAKVEIEEL